MALKTVELNVGTAGELSINPSAKAHKVASQLSDFIHASALGVKSCRSFRVLDTATAASVEITLASVAANTVILVNGVPFTAVSGAATAGNNEFDISGADAADATALAAAINASTTTGIAGVVTASAATATVTVTTVDATLAANGLTVESLGVVAAGTVTYVTPSGTQTITLNGVTVYNATAGATAALTATAAAAAINASADASVQPYFRALARAGVVHIFSKMGGVIGNSFTLAATGTGATASGARLTGGTIATFEGAQATVGLTVSGADGGTYTTTINGVGVNATGSVGDDAATGVSIVAAINASTNSLVRDHVVAATTGAGTLSVTARKGGLVGNLISIAATGTGYTVDGAKTALAEGAAPTAVTGTTVAVQPNGYRASGGSSGTVTTFTF